MTGLALENPSSPDLLYRSSITALSWLAIGPWLFANAVRLSKEFLESLRSSFPSDERWAEIRAAYLRRLSEGWWRFGIPWSAAVTAVVVWVLYPHARGLRLVWVVLSFGTLFLISGAGFWGVGAMVRLVRDVSNIGIAYRPYHPDRFGGMASVGTFAVRGALYFSSGALVLPLAFDAIAIAENSGRPALSILAYIVTITFVLFVICAFALPIFDIKRFADAERARVTADGRAKLDSLIDEYCREPAHNEQLAHRIQFCYQMEYGELSHLREYPYDLRVIVELLVAAAVPLGVGVMEILWR